MGRLPNRNTVGLTPQQVRIVRLVADGQTNAEIATALGVTEDTVRSHLNILRDRFTIDGRRDQRWLVRVAYQLGQVERDLQPAS